MSSIGAAALNCVMPRCVMLYDTTSTSLKVLKPVAFPASPPGTRRPCDRFAQVAGWADEQRALVTLRSVLRQARHVGGSECARSEPALHRAGGLAVTGVELYSEDQTSYHKPGIQAAVSISPGSAADNSLISDEQVIGSTNTPSSVMDGCDRTIFI